MAKYDPNEFFHHKKTTNADRIRAMSDVELAEWIIEQTEDDTPGWLDWLRSPAEGTE